MAGQQESVTSGGLDPLPHPQLMTAQGTGISCNISLRKVEVDEH